MITPAQIIVDMEVAKGQRKHVDGDQVPPSAGEARAIMNAVRRATDMAVCKSLASARTIRTILTCSSQGAKAGESLVLQSHALN